MIELSECRKRIDEIDNQMVELFKQRMAVAKDVAEYKKANNRQPMDESRERQLLTRVSELAGPELAGYSRRLYSMMMEISRAYQQNIIHPVCENVENINKALEETPKIFPPLATVACQELKEPIASLLLQSSLRFQLLPIIRHLNRCFRLLRVVNVSMVCSQSKTQQQAL